MSFEGEDSDASPYQYSHNNPVSRADIDGRADFGSAGKLMEAGKKALNDPNLQPLKDSKENIVCTFCNFGVQEILHIGNDYTLDGMGANEMYNFLSDERNATEISYEKAVEYAMMGITVILAAKNEFGPGHVAIVAPKKTEPSGTWRENVPWIFNIG